MADQYNIDKWYYNIERCLVISYVSCLFKFIHNNIHTNPKFEFDFLRCDDYCRNVDSLCNQTRALQVEILFGKAWKELNIQIVFEAWECQILEYINEETDWNWLRALWIKSRTSPAWRLELKSELIQFGWETFHDAELSDGCLFSHLSKWDVHKRTWVKPSMKICYFRCSV